MLASPCLEELTFQVPPETMVPLVHTLLPFTPAGDEAVTSRPSGHSPTILPAPKLRSLDLSFCPRINDHTYADMQTNILANVIRTVHDARAHWKGANNQHVSQENTGLQSIRVPSCLFSCSSALADLETSGHSYLCNCLNQ